VYDSELTGTVLLAQVLNQRCIWVMRFSFLLFSESPGGGAHSLIYRKSCSIPSFFIFPALVQIHPCIFMTKVTRS